MSGAEAGTPDLIHVEVSLREEVQADRADLYVTVRGSSLVTGTAALTKAREVGQLVADLRQVGIEEEDVYLQGVQAEVSTGVLGRNSLAKYALKIRCKSLDRLADVLGAITAQKNSTLTALQWGYPDGEEAQDRLLARTITRARAKAALIAESLGVTLGGVAGFRDTIQDTESGLRRIDLDREEPAYARRRAVRAMTEEDLGMEVSHTKQITFHVFVDYHIASAA